jgi:hypothetical protein
MAIATAQGKENAAAGYTGPATHVSVHTADPGTTGANEATGGSPAYARIPIVWSAGGVDGVYQSQLISIDLPAGSYTHVGLWTALTGGTFLDKSAITLTMAAQGLFKIILTTTAS